MKKLLLTFLLMSGLSVAAQNVCRPVSAPLDGGRSDRFDFRVGQSRQIPDDGVTRVDGVLVGIPHTSNRIDMVVLVNGRDSITATDIDGIDFNRYFQWEDEGLIPLEIDFPRSSVTGKLPVVGKNSKLIFKTVRGTVVID